MQLTNNLIFLSSGGIGLIQIGLPYLLFREVQIHIEWTYWSSMWVAPSQKSNDFKIVSIIEEHSVSIPAKELLQHI